MSHSPEEMRELRRLIHALHEQCIAPEEIARLEQWVCRDKEARRIYVRYMNLYAGLRWRNMQEPQPEESLPNDKVQTTRLPAIGFLGNAFQAGMHFFSRSFVLTLLLAIGLPAVILVVLLFDLASQPVPTTPVAATPKRVAPSLSPVVVGTITQANSAVWGKNDGDLSIGTSLITGREIQLREGLAELTFKNGAQVILRGPTAFRIDGSESGYLKVGSLVATIPSEAHGFTIHTPIATVVDLGTEFGVSVGTDNSFETHVFKGRVEIGTKSNQDEPTRVFETLDAGQSAMIQLVGTEKILKIGKITSMSKQFIRRIPPETNEGLPEPRIIHAHHGDSDPTTEGWTVNWVGRRGSEPMDHSLGNVKPIDDKGTLAWSMDDRAERIGIHYIVAKKTGLTPERMSEARAKGWVLRARLKVMGSESYKHGLGFCSYWEEQRQWILRPTIGRDGQQRLYLPGWSTLGKKAMVEIPDSRDRYVDYEMRYHPVTNDADIFVNNRFVATIKGTPNSHGSKLRFGTFKQKVSEMRCELVEWGILDE